MRNRFLCTTTLALAIVGASEVTWGEPVAMSAQPQDPDAAAQGPEAAAAAAPDEPKKNKGKKTENEDREFKLKGRVFVRDTISRDGWTNQLELASARAGVLYRDRAYGLRIEVEAELAGRNAEVRDAYLRLDPNKYVRVQAGRFKRPISAVALASRWDLPVIERGYLNDLQINGLAPEPDELPLSGRFLGVATTLRDTALPGRPELIIGVFRSAVHDQLPGRPLDWSKQFPEDIFSRLEVEPLPGFKLATSLAWVGQVETTGDPSSFRHGFVSSLDAVVEMGMFRGWFEAFTGTSTLHLTAGGQALGRFQATRAIASGRLPVTDTIYVEPYVTFQYLDSSSELEDDRIIQGGGGINLGVGEGWRLQTAVDHSSVDRLLLYESSTLFQVQLATVF